MNKFRVLITILLCGLTAAAWTATGVSISKEKVVYETYCAEAEQYMAQGLYQKAVSSLEKALEIKEEEPTRKMLAAAYQSAYADGAVTSKDLAKALYSYCSKYTGSSQEWEQLVLNEIDSLDLTAAYEHVQEALSYVDTAELMQMYQTLRYSYSEQNRSYAAVVESPYGLTAVSDGTYWGITDASGEAVKDMIYEYVSPANEENENVYVNSVDSRLIDADGVVQAIIPYDVREARAYGDGLVPVRTEEGWQYLKLDGSFALGGYEDASSFRNGIAAAKKDGKWQLIATDGNAVCDTRFDDVKLFDNGDYAYGNVMVACENGSYGIYNAKGEKTCEFSAADMDVSFGDMLAYKDAGGKWGFVGPDGKVCIEPQYEAAQSFSCGLGAVYNGEGWGFISDTGETAIACQYAHVKHFTPDGCCYVGITEGTSFLLKLRF